MERLVVDTTRGQVEWSVEPPPGFKLLRRAAPTLGYPWEVAGAGDWDFSPSCPTTEAEEERFGGRPRLDLLPASRVFVWLLMGDLRRDYEVSPRSGLPTVPDQFLAPSGFTPGNGVAEHPAPFADEDRVDFGPLSSWDRLAFLINEDGVAEQESLYLMLKAFAGPARSSIAEVNSLVSSLSFRYMG